MRALPIVLLPILVLATLALAGMEEDAPSVVGGVPEERREAPWFVEVGSSCGGSLVAPDRVLTAAHCVAGQRTRALPPLRIGPGRTERRVEAVAIHPDYVRDVATGTIEKRARADVALLLLDRPYRGAEPVPLAEPADADALEGDRPARVVGRGVTAPGGERTASSLRTATLRIVGDDVCAQALGDRGGEDQREAFVGEQMLCAGDRGGREQYRSACFGDSGGPLLVRSRGALRQAGVVSWGLRCGALREPTVYADVVALRDFVRDRSPALGPVAGDQPARLSGRARPGSTLRCTAPPFRGARAGVAYQFELDLPLRRDEVRGGPSPRLRVRPSDAGARIRCRPIGLSRGGLEPARPSKVVAVPERR